MKRGAIGICGTAGLLVLLASVPSGQEGAVPEAGRVRQDLVVHPAFRLDLFASEPLIAEPRSVSWDAHGRTWVVEAGRVLVLEDPGRSGRPDRGRVFADELERATALVHLADGVLVATADGLLHLRDTTDDGEADVRETVLAFEPEEGTDATLTSLQFGLDGWVHAALASGGPVSATVRGGDVLRIAPGVVRLRADGSEIESVVAVPGGAHAAATTWDGELFFTTAGSHAAHVVLPDAAFAAGRVGDVSSWIDSTDHSYLERPEDGPGEGTFGRPAGNVVYDGGAWPPEFTGNHFVCEPDGGIVHRDRIRSWGVTYRAERLDEAEFLAASGPGFRPVDVAVGPDGALYVVDAPGEGAGRIWRVQSRAWEPESSIGVPALEEAQPADLVAELSSANGWRRATAHRLLRERGLDADARAELLGLARAATEPLIELQALWLTQDGRLVRSALVDYFEVLKKNALAVFRAAPVYGRKATSADVRGLLRDTNPRIALLALFTLGGVFDGQSHRDLVQLWPDLTDDWSRSAALAAASRNPTGVVSTLFREVRRDARRLRPEHEGLALHLVDAVVRSGSEREAVKLVLVLSEGEAAPGIVADVLRALAGTGEGEARPWPSPRLASALRRLCDDEDPRVAAAALPLAHRWLGDQLATRELADWSEELGRLAADRRSGVELRLEVLASLLAVPAGRATALVLVDGELEKSAWARVLVTALETGHIDAAEVGEERLARLRAHADADVAARAAALAPE
jgi:putative membrane-bound dehydrogenase-like protein